MTETIYRKHRPQTFAQVSGQEHIKQILQNELIHARLAHAYLFCGMRGIGKTTMARLLAKAVNCENRKDNEAEPCNRCQSCRDIMTGHSLDLIELDAASNRRIDDIREIREKVPYGTMRSRYKVVIIDEVHMLTAEAFNALLKTLEEPPHHVIFILATTEVHKLPETIISRCQRFDFKRLSVPAIKQRLQTIAKAEKIEIAEPVLSEIAFLANGSSRDAESYLGKLLSLGERTITSEQAHLVLPHSDIKISLEFVGYIVNNQAARAIEIVNRFLNEGGEINYFYKQVLELLRQLLLLKLGGTSTARAGFDYDDEVNKALLQYVAKLNYSRLQNLLSTWLDIEGQWRQADVYQLPLEMAVITMCDLAASEEKALPPKDNPTPAEIVVKPALSQSAAAGASKTAIDLAKVADKWGEIVNKIKERNHSLSFILSVAQPIKLQAGKLTIEFQYQLHQERVKDKKLKQIIEEVIKIETGADLIIEPVVGGGAVNKIGTTGNLLADVLNSLGGRVVE